MNSAALLPPNATAAEIALSLAVARAGDVPPKCREMWSADNCPASHLPWLAWALSVDEWRHDWPEARKRAVIRASFTVHKHKGTVGAMRAALAAIGYDIELAEWYQETPHAEPYTFGLTAELDGRGIDAGLWDEIESVALAAKNARSHLRYIRLRSTTRGKFYVGGTTIAAEIVSVEPYKLTQIESRGPAYVGAACVAYETVEIFPRGPLVLGLVDGAPLALADAAPLALMN